MSLTPDVNENPVSYILALSLQRKELLHDREAAIFLLRDLLQPEWRT